MNQEYIPEYNPKKYKNACKVVKYLSIIFLSLAILIPFKIIFDALYTDKYMGYVRDVYKINWDIPILFSLITFGCLGTASLLLFVLYKRLNQANSIFSEPNANIRKQMHEKFDEQAKLAAKVSMGAKIIEHTIKK